MPKKLSSIYQHSGPSQTSPALRLIFRRSTIVFGLLIYSILINGVVLGQTEHPITGRENRSGHGAWGGADWLERPEREWEETPEQMLDALQLKKGQTVADVGAGVGYLTLRIAKRIGPSGKGLWSGCAKGHASSGCAKMPQEPSFRTSSRLLGAENDPKLPAGEIDPHPDGRRLS